MGISTDLLVRLLSIAVTVGAVYGLMREKIKALQTSADELKATASTLKTGMDQQVIINKSFAERMDNHRERLDYITKDLGEVKSDVAVLKERTKTARYVVEQARASGPGSL